MCWVRCHRARPSGAGDRQQGSRRRSGRFTLGPWRHDLRSKNSESAHRHPLADPGGPSQSPLAKVYHPSTACNGPGGLWGVRASFGTSCQLWWRSETAVLQLWGRTTVTSPFRATSVIISGSDKINQQLHATLPQQLNCGSHGWMAGPPSHPIRRPNLHSHSHQTNRVQVSPLAE